ncbi:hypothetical protein CN115_34480 [Sinorhizobium meliloti]|nr:hypothetical protein [Sinorhizobium meliloti]MDX0165211.1 hypothetical protein [Sinorhizobium meliloti]RMI10406.1 hypothetical protein DA101_003335 [Sinorhizobium meliloti]RVM99860.1 hypothetical protein CN115_34480 [Sinorhizobium meliloti]RVN17902.1 hypothetical protein CN114_26775 [Sinorhizobium meliloti]
MTFVSVTERNVRLSELPMQQTTTPHPSGRPDAGSAERVRLPNPTTRNSGDRHDRKH